MCSSSGSFSSGVDGHKPISGGSDFNIAARMFSEGIANLVTSSCFERNELPGAYKFLATPAEMGHVAELVGIVGGVVSGVINLESSGA